LALDGTVLKTFFNGFFANKDGFLNHKRNKIAILCDYKVIQ